LIGNFAYAGQNPVTDRNAILHRGIIDILDVVTPANFGSNLQAFSDGRGRISGFSIDFQRRPYNTLSLPVPACDKVSKSKK